MKYNLNNDDIGYFKLTTLFIKMLALVLGFIILFFSQYTFIFYSAAMLPTMIIVFVDRRYLKCN